MRRPKLIFFENLYALNVARIIEKHDIDLIHAHFAYPEGFIGLIAKEEDKPLAVTLHGYDVLTEQSVGYGVRLSKRLDSMVTKVIRNADAVICNSSATYKEAFKIRGNRKGLCLIYVSVDVNRFRPDLVGKTVRERLGINGDYIIFTLRNHEPKYGIEYLIKAVPLVIEKRRDAKFIIGGDGSLRKHHEELARTLGVKDYIIFTGKIERDEVPYYNAASDIVVVPSLQEAFGLVVSEAMACSKPVIGTNVGGIPEQIVDGVNGFLVETRDPKGIAEKILLLLEDEKLRSNMGKEGRKIVEKKFNIDKNIEKIISLYKSLTK